MLKITKYGILLCLCQTVSPAKSSSDSVHFFCALLADTSLPFPVLATHGVLFEWWHHCSLVKVCFELKRTWLLFSSIYNNFCYLALTLGRWQCYFLWVSSCPVNTGFVFIISTLSTVKDLSGPREVRALELSSQRTSRSQCQGKSESDFSLNGIIQSAVLSRLKLIKTAFLLLLLELTQGLFLFPSNFKKCARDFFGGSA